MKINTNVMKKKRELRAWSQQHLAEVSELSLRTIQRIENTGNASPESIKAIAACLELTPHELYQNTETKNNTKPTKNSLIEKYHYTLTKFRIKKASIAVLTSSFLMLITTIYSNTVIAEPTTFKFSGEVRIDQNSTLAFGVSVMLRQVHIIDLDSEHKLLLISPTKNGKLAETEVRLLKQDGTSYKILHKATNIGSDAIERSFSYRVCGNQPTFYNRALEIIPTCDK